MTPTLWERISRIVGEAIEQPEVDRKRFLAEACENDTALLREAASLMNAYENPPRVLAALGGREAERPHIQQEIGAYTTEGVIGFGGMGVVYIGRRTDKEVRKAVAIKVLQRVLMNEESLQRFRREREILATLDHPNIARLFDGGSTDHGEPYFVMEYVQGAESLVTYCRRLELPLRERLRLFLDACAAVQYAHQQMVLHRDLKPSNILVSARGEVKLVDFGIAKDLSADADLSAPTLPGMLALTPEYASPEQIKGDPIGVASDVYSLGVVLYQLTTGHLPFRLEKPLPDFLETVLGEPPRKPSLAGPARNRELAGDLDNIILMTLRKEPSRRYASVEQLSADIGRHLEGRPVLARKATLPYVAHRFLKRHAAASVAAALLVASLTGGIVTTRRQALLSEENATRSQDGYKHLHALTRELLMSKSFAGGSNAELHSLAQGYLEKLRKQPPGDSESSLSLASTFLHFGTICWLGPRKELRDPVRARAFFESAMQLASAAKAARGETVGSLQATMQALLSLGNLASALGAYDDALHRYQLAGFSARKLDQTKGATTGKLHLAVDMKIAQALLSLGEAAKGFEHLRGTIREAEHGFRSTTIGSSRQYLFYSLLQIGEAYLRQGSWDDAIRELGRCYPLLERKFEFIGLDERDRIPLELALGKAYLGKGEHRRAGGHIQLATHLAKKHAPASLPGFCDLRLVMPHILRGHAFLNQRNLSSAKAHFRTAASSLERCAPSNANPLSDLQLHNELSNLECRIALMEGDRGTAERLFSAVVGRTEGMLKVHPTIGVRQELRKAYRQAAEFYQRQEASGVERDRSHRESKRFLALEKEVMGAGSLQGPG